MQRSKFWVAISVIVLSLGVAGIVSAAVFDATADSETDINNPTTNKGNSEQINAATTFFNGTTTQSNLVFLKFDLSPVSWEISSSTTPSVLDIVVSVSSGDGLNDGNLVLYAVNDDSWTETGINAANRPALGSELATIPVPTSTGLISFGSQDLVDFLNEQSAATSGGDTISGDNTASFAIGIQGNTDIFSFVSFEAKESLVSPGPVLNLFSPTAVKLGTISSSTGRDDRLIWIISGLGMALAASLLVVQRFKKGSVETDQI